MTSSNSNLAIILCRRDDEANVREAAIAFTYADSFNEDDREDTAENRQVHTIYVHLESVSCCERML